MLVIEDEGNIKEEIVQPFIDFADKQINAALAPHYTLPIVNANALTILNVVSIGLSLETIYSFNQEGDIPKGIERIINKAKEQLALYTGSVNQQSGAVIPPAQMLPGSSKVTKIHVTAPAALDFDSVLGYQSPNSNISV